MIPGSPAEAAKELIKRLREDEGDPVMIIVIAEQREGRLNRATWETIAAAHQAGSAVRRLPCRVERGRRRDGSRGRRRRRSDRRQRTGACRLPADGYVAALSALIAEETPDLVFPHTYQTATSRPRSRRGWDARS